MELLNKIGYDQSIFVVQPAENLNCPICLHVLKDPKQCSNGHLFCYYCICMEISRRKACPSCKIKLTKETFATNLFVRETIDSLTTLCMSHDEVSSGNNTLLSNCQWIGPLHSRQQHYNQDCQYFPVVCPNQGCIEKIPKMHLKKHMDTICEFTLKCCDYCHSQNITRRDLKKHKLLCPERPVACSCGQIMPQSKHEQHIQNNCELTILPCPRFESKICVPSCPKHALRSVMNEHIMDPVALSFAVVKLTSSNRKFEKENKELVEKVKDLTTRNAFLDTKSDELSQLVQKLQQSAADGCVKTFSTTPAPVEQNQDISIQLSVSNNNDSVIDSQSRLTSANISDLNSLLTSMDINGTNDDVNNGCSYSKLTNKLTNSALENSTNCTINEPFIKKIVEYSKTAMYNLNIYPDSYRATILNFHTNSHQYFASIIHSITAYNKLIQVVIYNVTTTLKLNEAPIVFHGIIEFFQSFVSHELHGQRFVAQMKTAAKRNTVVAHIVKQLRFRSESNITEEEYSKLKSTVFVISDDKRRMCNGRYTHVSVAKKSGYFIRSSGNSKKSYIIIITRSETVPTEWIIQKVLQPVDMLINPADILTETNVEVLYWYICSREFLPTDQMKWLMGEGGLPVPNVTCESAVKIK